ncbi:AcvB/VirJ family lysyl-phosphatidylglycerol hydrolase [Paraburkholderia sp. BL10I2N1]|uniref:virulence factor family protein n=1 Tax=Paraburkholderia sp. BL10I2N1 TaxID=1938796 RepID=UPI00105F2E0E|nr:AcvB/VirJ family lysyl-phosphatidylglycerol hydrolase [Paraburkholderia sp. BL10I2N1]TDN69400.1 type IV secretory pathway VirJ component [Paraburkholderia sp. BL10I2N1]
MKSLKVLLALSLATGLFAAALPSAHAVVATDLATSAVSGGRYGNVVVTRPTGEMRGFVVLFSGRSGWRPTDQQAADALARHGAMVVGVDTERYAGMPATRKETCRNLVGDAEAMSHQLQREVQSSRYFLPIVAGTGQGGILATQMLAQAPSNTLSGAASIDPDAQLDARFNPCPPDPTISRGNGLPGFVEIGATTADAVRTPTPAGGKPVAVRRLPPDTSSADAMVTLLGSHLRMHEASEQDVSDLPLIELPAAHPTDMLAVVISGDGGWRDLDKSIAEALQKQGVSVVGWDSLRYFWATKSPQETSHDLARVLETYGSRWHTRQVALIGYSFGADVMPFAYNRLPEALRAKVSQMALLGFAHSADFQIRVTGWLGMPASNEALPALPEVSKVPPGIVQCVYGEDEEDTLCPTLAKSGVTVLRTAGGHHFGRDYSSLANSLLDNWRRQIASRECDATKAPAGGAPAAGCNTK